MCQQYRKVRDPDSAQPFSPIPDIVLLDDKRTNFGSFLFFAHLFHFPPPLTSFAGDIVSNLACSSRTLLRSSIPARLPRFLSYPFSLIWKKANNCGRERRRGM